MAVLTLCVVSLTAPARSIEPAKSSAPDQASTIEARISPPTGYERTVASRGSFGAWLRALPLRPGRPPIRLYDGRLKSNQDVHFAVVDMDVGSKDLQQCADAVIRLRAEYLFAGPCRDEIRFRFTSGDAASWKDWRLGKRPTIDGNRVSWRRTAAMDSSYRNFRRYLDTVFTYAGSASLSRELVPAGNPAAPEIGDVFIQGGFPGHAVVVVDVAVNRNGERVFLLAQSFMPAQEIHILTSLEDVKPWYRARASGVLRTPEWSFVYQDLKRFPPSSCETTRAKN